MRCPFCHEDDTQVKDSRPSEEGHSIRRRRFCPSCDSRFTTFERVQLRDMTVVKRSGDQTVFDREKVVRSIAIATRKRPVSEEQREQMVNKIVRTLEASGDTDIPVNRIGQTVMDALAEVDKVAYIRFASVYKDFREPKDFEEFLDKIKS